MQVDRDIERGVKEMERTDRPVMQDRTGQAHHAPSTTMYDVIVVGSGATGGVAAKELGEKG